MVPRKCIYQKHRCRSRQNFWGAKDFCPNFPKLAWKVFLGLLPIHFVPQRTRRLFLLLPPKKVFMCFSENVRRHFFKSNTLGGICARIFRDFAHIFKDFSRILRDFWQIRIFGNALAPPALPPSISLIRKRNLHKTHEITENSQRVLNYTKEV